MYFEYLVLKRNVSKRHCTRKSYFLSNDKAPIIFLPFLVRCVEFVVFNLFTRINSGKILISQIAPPLEYRLLGGTDKNTSAAFSKVMLILIDDATPKPSAVLKVNAKAEAVKA
jgi:hypothetical protein